MGNPVDPFGKGEIKYGDAGERQAVERLLRIERNLLDFCSLLWEH